MNETIQMAAGIVHIATSSGVWLGGMWFMVKEIIHQLKRR
jgi:hypothetical protein